MPGKMLSKKLIYPLFIEKFDVLREYLEIN